MIRDMSLTWTERLSAHVRRLLFGAAVACLLLGGCGEERTQKRSLEQIKEILSAAPGRIEQGRTLNKTVLQGAEIGRELEMTFEGGSSHPIKTYRFESITDAEGALARNKHGIRDGFWIFVGMDERTREAVRNALRSAN